MPPGGGGQGRISPPDNWGPISSSRETNVRCGGVVSLSTVCTILQCSDQCTRWSGLTFVESVASNPWLVARSLGGDRTTLRSIKIMEGDVGSGLLCLVDPQSFLLGRPGCQSSIVLFF